MRRPSRVKIGAHWYKIEWVPFAAIEGRYVGLCFHQAKKIRVAAEQPKRQLAQTLLHEIMHAIYYEWGLTNSEMEAEDYQAGMLSEENVVNGISLGLTTVFADNPNLLAWVRWCLS